MKSRYPERRIAVCLIFGTACFLVACQPRSPSSVITTASPGVAVGATSSPTVAQAQSVAISQPTPEVTPAAVQPTPPVAPGELVFTSNRSELAATEPGDIYLADADGSDLYRGSRADSPKRQLYLLDLASGETRQLTDFRYGATFPVWSIDGSQIAFAGVRDDAYGYYDIYLLDVEAALGNALLSDADVRRLTRESGWTYPVSWAADGQSVLANRIWGEQGEHFEALRVSTDESAAVTRFADPIVAAASWPSSWQDNQIEVAVELPSAGSAAPPTLSPVVIALVNGGLIDGTGAEPVPNAVVVIRAGRVEAVGPADQIAIPAEAHVIDVQGGTILPGFFNAHVHEAYDAGHLAAWTQAGVTHDRTGHLLVADDGAVAGGWHGTGHPEPTSQVRTRWRPGCPGYRPCRL